jgi:hypothetical protein
MSEQREFLRRLVGMLEDTGIPYMVAGSLGSSFHGHPRATNDVDMVIAPTEAQLRCFLSRLGSDYYVSEEAAWSALHRGSTFNIIDMRTQWKADLRILQDRPFSHMEFSRRKKAPVLGLDVWLVSPEDAILSKLEWARESASRQQLRDVLGVLEVQYGHLDREYLLKWAQDLGVRQKLIELLEKARSESEPFDDEL